jgi:hypothetical protein
MVSHWQVKVAWNEDESNEYWFNLPLTAKRAIIDLENNMAAVPPLGEVNAVVP